MNVLLAGGSQYYQYLPGVGVLVMGFRFRRSVRILPGIKLNFSGSGTSVSLGGRGFHYTLGPKGTRVTAGIPGTGLSWTQYSAYSSSSASAAGAPIPLPAYDPVPHPAHDELEEIQNASASEISALSTSQLVPVLNSAARRLRIAPFVQFAGLVLFVGALLQMNQLWLGLSALYATMLVPLAIYLDRYRRSVKVIYDSSGLVSRIAEALALAFTELSACKAVWTVQAEGRIADWKRNAGAAGQLRRKRVTLRFDRPLCFRGKARFPAFKMTPDELYLLPDSALVVVNGTAAAVSYRDLDFSFSLTRFIEEEGVPSDSRVVDHTWRYVNKAGGPDRRFAGNRQLPVCAYGEMSFRTEGGLHCKFHLSNPEAANLLYRAIEALRRTTQELPQSITYIGTARRWPTIVFLSCSILLGVAQLAFLKNGILPRSGGFLYSLPAANEKTSASVRPPADAAMAGPRVGAGQPQPAQALAPPLELKPPAPMVSADSTTIPDPGSLQEPLDLSRVENLRWVQLRLRQLGFLKGGSASWDAASRLALRDFKTTNNIGNDDRWDFTAEELLASNSALRADQTFIGSWSEATCGAGSRPEIVINSYRATSAVGGVCEFSNLKQGGSSWSIATTCSNAGEKWSANIRLAVTDGKLIWVGRDGSATEYARCH